MQANDSRTKFANQIFSSIKFVKINAFEQYFQKKLYELRDKEISLIRWRFSMSCLAILTVWMTPMLIINAIIIIFISLGNELEAGNIFAIISLFEVL